MAADLSAQIISSVKDAHASEQSLVISGQGSKSAWLPDAVIGAGGSLDVTGHSGIQAYQPEELVITARAGTSLEEINAVLAAEGQMLACDPPRFQPTQADGVVGDNAGGTLGGVVATGLSGPGRPWSGAVRDAILGVELVNGKGEYLKFGGQVMKNVAGYDVSRLQAGAWGNLGVLASISIRVHPVWQDQCTLVFQMSAEQAQQKCLRLAQQNLPLQGSCWQDGVLSLRLGGHASGVAGAKLALSGEVLQGGIDLEYWANLRDHKADFFQQQLSSQMPGAKKIWRLVVPSAAPLPGSWLNADDLLIEWGGGLRWLRHDDDAAVVAYAKSVGGWCWAKGELMPIDPVQGRYMGELKRAFDPKNIFLSPMALKQTLQQHQQTGPQYAD
ncbi:MAG: glycolate oxidase subunit GlcE [Pseudomonadales bacterium]|jgi:glycolate oxidase FAD binding subunit|nr:glycolate oxidase subunit GlcE [Pseudomonadales bacterium]